MAPVRSKAGIRREIGRGARLGEAREVLGVLWGLGLRLLIAEQRCAARAAPWGCGQGSG